MQKTRQLTVDEFKGRIARISDVIAQTDIHAQTSDVNRQAYEYVSVKELYYLMGLVKQSPTGKVMTPALEAGDGCSVYIVGSPPGDGPTLHAHMKSWENFVVLKGTYRFSVGDHGELTADLGPFDTFSCPPGVSRKFENVSDEQGLLLAIITGEEDVLNDIALSDDIAEDVSRRFGENARESLEKAGMNFTLEKAEAGEPAKV